MTTFQDRSSLTTASPVPAQTPADFVDRRQSNDGSPGVERRQFGNSHDGLSADARELAEAIDAYKVRNHRRFVTFEEMLQVMHDLGYRRS